VTADREVRSGGGNKMGKKEQKDSFLFFLLLFALFVSAYEPIKK
jgi:hypothetical protein